MIKLEIACHNGDIFHTEVQTYDPVELSEQINNHENLVIPLGDLIFSKIEIKRIVPIEQEQSAPVKEPSQ